MQNNLNTDLTYDKFAVFYHSKCSPTQTNVLKQHGKLLMFCVLFLCLWYYMMKSSCPAMHSEHDAYKSWPTDPLAWLCFRMVWLRSSKCQDSASNLVTLPGPFTHSKNQHYSLSQWQHCSVNCKFYPWH